MTDTPDNISISDSGVEEILLPLHSAHCDKVSAIPANTPPELRYSKPCDCGVAVVLPRLNLAIETLLIKAKIDELERVMKISGNAFVGNGESEIHYQTRNRINKLKDQLNIHTEDKNG